MADRIAVLRDGILQQVAEPLVLYNEPKNRFVASFIGSPAMNFVDGAVEASRFRAPGFEVPLDGRLGRAGARSGPVTLGIRPEEIDLVGEEPVPAETAPAGDGIVVGSARAVEPLGNEVFLHVEVSGVPLLARIGPGFLPRVGSAYRLRIHTGQAHLFDPRSGESLIPVPAA